MSRNRPRRQSSSAVSGASPHTVRETLLVRLAVETARYLEMRAIPFGEDPSAQEKVQRGIVRGMAVAITKMWGNGYEPYWKQEIKACEARAARLAKEWISDGKPEDDGWWTARADQLWRSSADASRIRD